MYGVFNSDAETENQELAERFSISFIPSTGEFAHTSVSNTKTSINLKNMLDTTKLLPELEKFGAADRNRIAEATERFKDYEFPVVTIKDRTNQEVCRVFQRINSSGTSLSTLELLSAWTWSEQFDLRNEIAELLDRLSDRGYDDIGETLILRCLGCVVQDDIETDNLVDTSPEELIEGIATLNQAIDATIDFLEAEIKIRNSVFLPYPIMLVPLVRFFSDNLKPDAAQRKQLRKWFWHCAFTERYAAGTNTLVREDIKSMHELADGKKPFAELTANIQHWLFMRSWRINSLASKATICLLAQYRPKSFLSGQSIDLGKTLSAYNAREYHHIYPKAFLAKVGVNSYVANSAANICFLSAADNKKISARDPREYFKDIPSELRSSVFDGALIPEDVRTGSKPYMEFLRNRAALFAACANDLIKHGGPKPKTIPANGRKSKAPKG